MSSWMKEENCNIYAAAVYSYLKDSPHIVFMKDENLRYVGVSNAFLTSFGFNSPEEVLGKTDFDFLPKELAEQYAKDDRQILSSREYNINFLEPLPPTANVPRYSSSTKSVILDCNGNPVGIYGITKDITKEYEIKNAYDSEISFLFDLPENAYGAFLADVTDWRIERIQVSREGLFPVFQTLDEYKSNASNSVVRDEDIRNFFSTFDYNVLSEMYESGRREFSMDFLRRFEDGSVRWTQDCVQFLVNPENGHKMAVLVISDIHDKKLEQDRLLRAARQDSLTGLLNHHCTIFEIKRYLSAEGALGCHALFIIDLDNFKFVNDNFGHQTGDNVLTNVASSISSCFRDTDIVGRIGGDEFLVLMKNVDSSDDIRKKGHELIYNLRYIFSKSGSSVELSGSAGIALYSGNTKTFEALYSQADSALYKAKQSGKNNFALYGEYVTTGGISPLSDSSLFNSMQLTSLLDNMDGCVLVIEARDEEIKLIYVSPSAYKCLGIDAESHAGEDITPLSSMIYPNDRPLLNESIFRIVSSGKPESREYRVVTPDKTAWWILRGTLLPNTGNSYPRIVAVGTEITELKLAEDQLRFEELKNRTALAQSNILLCEVNFRNGNIRQYGKIAEELGIFNNTIFDSVEAFIDTGCIRSDYVEEFRRIYQNIFLGNDKEEYSIVFVTASGQNLPLRVHFQVICDEDGKPLQAIGVGQPMLMDSKELGLYRTMSQSGVVSIRIDDDFTLLYGNDRFYEILEYSRRDMENILNFSYIKYIHPDDLKMVRQRISDAVALGKTYVRWTMRINTGLGNLKYLQTGGNLELQPDGSYVINGMVVDLTEQKLTELALSTEKQKISLALSESNIFIWEHDLIKNKAIIPPKMQELFGIDSVLEDIPDSVIRSGMICEDSIEEYSRLYEQFQNGRETAEAELHLKSYEGKDLWLKFSFHLIFDAHGTPVTSLGIASDLTKLKASEERYSRLLAERENLSTDTIGSCWLNLSKNLCWDCKVSNDNMQKLTESGTVDDFFAFFSSQSTDEVSLSKISGVLCREGLIEAYSERKSLLSFEHKYLISPGKDEWIRTTVKMSRNPQTGDLEALLYAQSIHAEKTTRAITEKLSVIGYEYVAIIDVKTSIISCISKSKGTIMSMRSGSSYTKGYKKHFRNLILKSEVEDYIDKLSLEAIKKALELKDTYTLTITVKNRYGSLHRKKWQFLYLDHTHKEIICTCNDITDEYLTDMDPITGIYNRFKFRNAARRVLEENPDTRFVMARFDIDNFKVFNDLYGMDAGDRLLASAGEYFRSLDFPLMRYGHLEGDHFICCMPLKDLKRAPSVEKITQWIINKNPNFNFSPRVGIYCIDDPSLSITTMGDRALMALRSIKGNYRKHLAFYSESMRSALIREQQILTEMDKALACEQFVIHLQPQYDYAADKLIGAEVLVRWNHPSMGLILPGEFIPISENNGFITLIDRLVWEQAAKLLRKWIDEGTPVVPLSINVSRVDIYDPDICSTLQNLLDKYSLDPSLLRLEITETAYMCHPEQLIKTVNDLRNLGFYVEMDDFGSGYSSLNMLKDVPVDMLKLDMRFVHTYKGTERDRNILVSMVRLSHWLELPVMAEGIETQEQADYLNSIGCPLMQGYYFAKPCPVDEFKKILLNSDCTKAQ